MPIPSNLQFDAGTPPSQWIKFGQSVGMKTRILSLWEMIEELIHNEKILSKDPDRFLAMIHDHKRFFELIKDDNGVCICHVEETKYLHSKLVGRAEPPSSHPIGFRSLEPVAVDTADLSPPSGILKQDEELSMLFEHIKFVNRAINELEGAKMIIKIFLYREIIDSEPQSVLSFME